VRVVSWNLNRRVGDAVRRQGEFLSSLEPPPSAVMLQEVNPRSIELMCERAGLDWFRLAVDLREPEPSDTRVRRLGVALAGRGAAPHSVSILEGVPFPERTIHAVIDITGATIALASYHAPPGVSWLEKKPKQAVAFANWLAALEGPVILGADANTPLVDHPDFEGVRTHWHSGDRRLKGAPGDDLLWAATKIHGLEDALRNLLRGDPEALAEIRAASPQGPLAISYRTSKRTTLPGTLRRYDSVWISDHFGVTSVAYPYEESIQAGSDHSAVVVDLVLHEPR
jgi:hypothetical protein